MSDLVKTGQGALIQYLANNGGGLTLPTPFEQDIYLFDTYVAGTSHVEGIDKIGNSLKEDDRLVFYREPDNPYDPQAIRIETLEGKKIGYVPKQDNVIFPGLWTRGRCSSPRL